MSFQLLIAAGPDKGKVFTLQQGSDLMLGRSAQALYQISDPRVSRNHCQILLDGEQPIVICNGGSGGTLINGKPIKRQPLKPGDVLQIGDTQLRLQIADFPLEVAKEILGPAKAAPVTPIVKPDQLEALAGKKLSHYDLGLVIGRGSTSVVFHATDTKDNRDVALKVLLPEFAKSEDEVQRFIRAMKTVLPLKHPNLIGVYNAGKTGPHCWVAMEYVAGENLTQVIERIGVAGMLDWRHAFKAAIQIARALEYAHEQQIIHRNVTPKNILRDATNQDVKLGDLMKAKALEGVLAQQITRPGELIGDVTYMSPERTRGTTEIDGRADLYGLGATCYALLTGRPPFEGKTLVERITRIRQDDPVKPTKFQMSIPSAFEGAILKLLAKSPEDRYQTATELIKELTRIGKYNGVQM